MSDNSKGQIFLGNLNYRANVDDVREAFAVQNIRIGDVRIPEDAEGDRKGFAFVDIAEDEPLEISEIISMVNGMEICGRECRADRATPKPQKGGKQNRGGDRRESSGRRSNHGGKPGGRVRARDDHDEPSGW